MIRFPGFGRFSAGVLIPMFALPPSGASAQAVSSLPTVAKSIPAIEITGTSLGRTIDVVAKAFVGRPETEAVLQQLAVKLADTYAASDVAIYTITITGIDAGTGIVHVDILEGFVEHLTYSGDVGARGAERVRAIAGTMKRERPLRKRTMQRALRLIGGLPGMTVVADMSNGTLPAGLAIHFTLTKKSPHGALSLDNYGSSWLGRTSLGGILTIPDLVRSGDELNLVASGSARSDFYRSLGLSYATPLGHDGLQLTVTGGYLRTRPKFYSLTGKADVESATLSYPLALRTGRDLVASLSVGRTNSNIDIFGIPIATERTRAVRGGISYLASSSRMSTLLSATLSRGLAIAGAEVTPPLGRAKFTKANFGLGMDRAIGKKFVLRLRGAAQYTPDALASGESFAVGGAQFGRAFENAVISGDSGYAGSLELGRQFPSASETRRFEAYAFVDGAELRQNRRYPYPSAQYRLASTGIGFRSSGKFVDIDVAAAKTLLKPYPMPGSGWRLSLGCQVHFGN